MKILDEMELKVLIDTSFDDHEADRYIEEKTGITDYRKKIELLMKLYDAEIMYTNPSKYDKDDYKSLLHSIVYHYYS